jgi:hypothetical protein
LDARDATRHLRAHAHEKKTNAKRRDDDNFLLLAGFHRAASDVLFAEEQL